jgi:hypothetical protein
VALFAAFAIAEASASGEPSAFASTRVVELVVVGNDNQLTVLREALGPHELRAAQVRWLQASRVEAGDVLRARPSNVAVTCYIDLSALPRARLYFADRSAQHFLARVLDLDHGLDALGKEEVGQIVASSIDVLLDDAASGMDPQQIASVLAEHPTAADAEPATTRVSSAESGSVTSGLGAFYAVQAFARDIPLSQGPGVFSTVGVPYGTSRLSLRASAQLVLPQRLETPLVGARLDTIAVRLGAGGERDLGEYIRVGLWLGGGVDVIYIDPRQGSTRVARLSSPHYAQATLLSAVAGMSVRVGRDVRVVAAFLVDTDLRPRHYDLATPAGVNNVLEPWAARPGVLVGVSAWQ